MHIICRQRHAMYTCTVLFEKLLKWPDSSPKIISGSDKSCKRQITRAPSLLVVAAAWPLLCLMLCGLVSVCLVTWRVLCAACEGEGLVWFWTMWISWIPMNWIPAPPLSLRVLVIVVFSNWIQSLWLILLLSAFFPLCYITTSKPCYGLEHVFTFVC